ncbi:MAG: hypothetical protein U9R23_02615 [Candidatus Cloacimonadota bacterium]|nr:hypothetical protein [Candidatus Cloacimonadota bacterium]
MIKKITSVVIIILFLTILVGCMAHVHKIGSGPQGKGIETARQWYALWGLIPINEVDTNSMAGETTDYEIKTETTLVDGLISCFTSYVTINCRTVTVTK